MRVLLDTNILLDVLLNRPALVDDSEAVILRCEKLDAEMLVAWHGLATAYYLLKRGRTEAEASHADCIVTRNTADYVRASVPAFLPQDFLKHFPEDSPTG